MLKLTFFLLTINIMEIDTNTYLYITVLVIVLVIISIIISSSSMSRSSVEKHEESKTEVKIISQNDLKGLPDISLHLSGGISGTSNSVNTASGPKEFKTKSSNTADLINQ